MKRTLVLIGIMYAAMAACAQVSAPGVINAGSSPSGNSCSNGVPIQYYSGTYYGCNGSTQVAFSVSTGTVNSISCVTANGVSCTSSGGSTPALTFTLGAITPTSVASTFYANQYAGADVSVQTQNCLNAAIAVHGTCDASMFSGTYTGLSAAIDVGDTGGDGVTLLLPVYGTWTWGNLNTSKCLVNQHNQTAILGPQTGLGTAYTFSFVAGSTTTAAGVFCQATTDTSASYGIYETTKGFGAQAVSGATLTNSASITASFSAYVLTVTAISSGYLAPGQLITGTGITPTVELVAPISVNSAGIGTWSLYGNASGSVGSETMTASQSGSLIFLNGIGDGSIVEGLGAAGGSVTGLYGVNAQNICCGATIKQVASYGAGSTFVPMILHATQMGAQYESISLSGIYGGNSLIVDGITGYGVPTMKGLYIEGPSAMSSNRVEVTAPAVASTVFGFKLSGMVEGAGLGTATSYAVDVQSAAHAELHDITPANALAIYDHNGIGYQAITAPYVAVLDYSTPRWTLLKDNGSLGTCTTSTSCTLTIQAVGSQPGVHVLVASTQGYGTAFHISAITATGGTQTLCPATGCYKSQSSRITDTAAVIGVTPGTTSVSVTFSAGPQYAPPMNVREYLWTGNNVAYDTGNSAGSTSCTTCAAPALTLGGNDAVMVSTFSDNNQTAVTGCFASSVSSLASPQPEAGCSNLLSYSAPNFTQASAGAFSASAMALKGQ